MNTIKNMFKNHPKPMLGVAFVVLLLVFGSVARCVNVAQSRKHAEKSPQAQQTQVQHEQPAKSLDVLKNKKIEAATDEISAKLQAYLCRNVFASGQKGSLRFEKNMIVQVDSSGKEIKTPYLVLAAKDKPSTYENMSSVRTSFVLQTPEGLKMCTLETVADSAEKPGFAALEGNVFGKDIFERVEPTKNFEVEIPTNLPAEIKLDEKKLKDKVNDHVAKNFPMATKATWQKSYTYDTQGKFISFSYTLDGLQNTTLTLTYDVNTCEISFEGANYVQK